MMERNVTERSGMTQNRMEWNRTEWNSDYIPLFGYFMMQHNNISIPLFGKWTEWNTHKFFIPFLPIFKKHYNYVKHIITKILSPSIQHLKKSS